MTYLENNLSMVNKMRKAAVFLQTQESIEAIGITITPYESNVLCIGDLHQAMPDGCTLTGGSYDDEFDETRFFYDGVKYFTLTHKPIKEEEE